MTRPHDFGFDETAQILKDTARRLLQDHCSPEQLHRLVAASSEPARASECVWDEALWRKMLDLGWTAVAVPEGLGGFGMGLVAIAGLVEEIGRAAAPSPLIATLCATYVAAACELSVRGGNQVKIHRIVAATDCGYAVNPAQIERQVSGSFVYGLSALFMQECTVKDGRIQQTNFHDYPSMRIAQMPKVETIIIEGGGPVWGGIGEPTICVAAPAVLNAIYRATGKRLRSVPLKHHGFELV